MSGNAAVRDADYFLAHGEEYEALSDEDKNTLLVNGFLEGDTPAADDANTNGKADDKPGEKAAAPDAANAEEANEAVDGGGKGDEPVVQAKDGKNIIPFSELQKSRDRVTELESLVQSKDELLQSKEELIESLKQAKIDDDKAGDGSTDNQDAVLAALKENFPELAEILSPVMEKMIASGVEKQVAALKQELNTKLEPLQKTAEQSAEEKHFATIAAAHADYEAVVDSKEFNDWKDSQPAYAKPGIEAVLAKGTATQVIDLLTDFKKATAPAAADNTLSKEEIEAEAKKAADKAKSGDVPKSLTDVPAGSKVNTDESAALLEASNASLMDKFAGKTPAQIEAMLNKVI